MWILFPKNAAIFEFDITAIQDHVERKSNPDTLELAYLK